MFQKLMSLDKSSNVKFSTKFSLLTLLFSFLPLLVINFISADKTVVVYMMLLNFASITAAFYLFKYKSQIILTWIGFIKLGSLISLLNGLYFLVPGFLFSFNSDRLFGDVLVINSILGVLFSIIACIFFENSPMKTKIKRLVSVVLFVWAIYNVIQRFLSSDKSGNESYGIDSDGDGVADSFDTDGDGKIDTMLIDSDRDGVNDMVAYDTDHDGIIDTVAADTDHDGRIDSVLADTNKDGRADIALNDLDSDGKTDTINLA